MTIIRDFKKFSRKISNCGEIKSITVFTLSDLTEKNRVDLLKSASKHLNLFAYSTRDAEDYFGFVREFLRSKNYNELLIDAESLNMIIDRDKFSKLYDQGECRESSSSIESKILDFFHDEDEIVRKHGAVQFNSIQLDFPHSYNDNSLLLKSRLFESAGSDLTEALQDFYSFYDLGIHDACLKVVMKSGRVFFLKSTRVKGNSNLNLEVFSDRGNKIAFKEMESVFEYAKESPVVDEELIGSAKSILESLFKDEYFSERYDNLSSICGIANEHYQ